MKINDTIPRDVPVTPTFPDPDDSQRRWALGLQSDGTPVFLTSFRDNDEWVIPHCLPDDDERGRFGLTPGRVLLWASMLGLLA